jgi:hypothetical protein
MVLYIKTQHVTYDIKFCNIYCFCIYFKYIVTPNIPFCCHQNVNVVYGSIQFCQNLWIFVLLRNER